MHLLIPFAAPPSDAARAALAQTPLPALHKLLRWLKPAERDTDDETSLSPPHERAWARALGLPVADGRIPWAAWEARELAPTAPDAAWAWITLCHWQPSTTGISMSDPQALGVTAAESELLLAAMRPYFNEDGIEIQAHSPARWLAQGEVFRDLACASVDRVALRRIDTWMPESPQSLPLKRLQNEMQMLLYTHPVNDTRAALGLPPINSFWFSAAGALPPTLAAPEPAHSPLLVPMDLRDAALAQDAAQWCACWQTLDRGPVTQALEQLRRSQPLRLTLCGERSAQRLVSGHWSLAQRAVQLLRKISVTELLQDL